MTRRKTLGVAIVVILLASAAMVAALLVQSGDSRADMVADARVQAADVVPLDAAAVARGHAVAIAGDCAACHTRPAGHAAASQGTPYAGGYAIETPFGSIVSTNITPDRKTGIGDWTERDFFQAVRHGRSPSGLLYPAMPYPSYVQISDTDMHDLWSYMRSLKPVSNDSGGTHLGFPYNIRLLMAGWNLLFFENHAFAADQSRPAEWNRGRYLVDALGHCGGCHTAKNALGGDKTYLAGGALQGWYAPALDNGTEHGLGNWSQDDLIAYLKIGSNNHAIAAGPMAEEVERSSQFMPPADLAAISTYLKSRPGPAHDRSTALATSDPEMLRGAHIYTAACSACHAPKGEGIPGLATHLADNPATRADNPASLIHVLMKGGRGAVTSGNPTGGGMPSFAWKLSDGDAAAVLTYIRNSWGNAAPAVEAGQIAKARSDLGARKAM